MCCLTTSVIFKFSFAPYNFVTGILCIAALVTASLKIPVVKDYTDLTGEPSSPELEVSTAITVLASLSLLVAVLGIVLALLQTRLFIALYCVLSVLLTCGLLASGIYQLSNEDQMVKFVSDAMLNRMNIFETDPDVWKELNHGQIQHECCGATDLQNWCYLNVTTADVPKSCCTLKAFFENKTHCNEDVCYRNVTDLQGIINTRSCSDAYVEDLGSLPQSAGIIVIFAAFMQFFGILAVVLVLGRKFLDPYGYDES